jgi:hypothetical protein
MSTTQGEYVIAYQAEQGLVGEKDGERETAGQAAQKKKRAKKPKAPFFFFFSMRSAELLH